MTRFRAFTKVPRPRDTPSPTTLEVMVIGLQTTRLRALALASALAALAAGACDCTRGCATEKKPEGLPAHARRGIPADVPDEELKRYPLKPEWLACTVDRDCALVPADCCGCASGGRDTSVAIKQFQAAAAGRVAQCPNPRCSMTRSDDVTCGAVDARCVRGQCKLVPHLAKGLDVKAAERPPELRAPNPAERDPHLLRNLQPAPAPAPTPATSHGAQP